MPEDKSTGRKILVRYLAITAFCLLVSVIYGHFSHGIRSFWMSWLALWPRVLGSCPRCFDRCGDFSLQGRFR